ncbi:MAG: TonB-dependent receptor [Edaphobacter sp.]
MTIRKLSFYLAFSAALAVALTGTSLAQMNTGTITGRITDSSGAIIPEATVTAKSTLTGQTRTDVSNSVGYYTFSQLPIGGYTITAQATGFKVAVQSGLVLSATQTISLNLQLAVGAVTETVTVSDAPPALNTTNPAQTSTVGTAEIHHLPLPKQDWTGLLNLNNGVSKGGNNGVSMNGLPSASMSVTVDGTNATPDPEIPTLSFYQGFSTINVINTTSIAEIVTTRGIAPASSGTGMMGNINIITKGGTNQFHGSLFELNQNAAFNARNPFVARKPRSNFNQFGGSLGGPILRNRLFAFGSYEGVRNATFTVINNQVPTPEFMVQVAALAPQYTSTLSTYPAPNQSYVPGAMSAVYTAAASKRQTDGNGVVRVDYYMTPSNLLTLRYTRSRPSALNPNVIAINPRSTTGHNDVYNAEYTHSGSSYTAATRFGYNRLRLNRLDEGFGSDLAQIQVKSLNTSGAEQFVMIGDVYTLQEDVSISHGKHTIKLGFIWQRNGSGRSDVTTTTYQYSSLNDFFSNIPSQIQVNFALPLYALNNSQYGGYAEDSYRVTPALTLNYGLRYDYFTVPKEKNNRLFTRDPSPLGPGTGALRPPNQLYKSQWPNFSPRLGFAWKTDPKTVVRGGFGLFFNPHTMYGGPLDDVLVNPYTPNRLTLSRAQALGMGLNFPVDKLALQQQLIANKAPAATTAIENPFRLPYSQQWLLDLQHDFGAGFVADVTYVGTRGLNLLFKNTANLPDRLTGIVPDPTFGQFGYYTTQDQSNYNALQTSLKRPFANGLLVALNYTWSRTFSFGDGDIGLQSAPQDANNVQANYGPSPFDRPNTFSGSLVYAPQFDRWAGFTGRGGRTLLGGWLVSGIFTASSGAPINIKNPNSSYPSDRPNRTPGVSFYLPGGTSKASPGYLNRAAFGVIPIAPASGASITTGNLSRNALRDQGVWNLDLSLAKSVPITEGVNFQFKADLFHSLNHISLGGLQTNLNNSNFGQFTSSPSRTIQIGGNLTF